MDECNNWTGCGPPCHMTRGEQIGQQVRDGLAAEGWEEGSLETWLEDLGTSWEDLM